MKNYFAMTKEEVLSKLNSKETGLTTGEVEIAIEKYGYNQLNEEKKLSTMQVFISQFKDFLVIILIIASIISIISGNVESAIVILVVIIINAILGTVQHLKAEESISSLKNLSAPKSKVLRDGEKVEVLSKYLVPGDIVFVEAGDVVPADGRVIESFSLLINESSLTGESEGVEKISSVIDKDELALGDQKNMVFSGSLVSYGRGVILVTTTGMKTELGKIASLLEATKEKQTPLQVSLDNFGKKLSIGIIILCILVFGINILHGVKLLDSLMFAVALAVAAIPEALSSIVTIVLAIGTQKLSKENAIIKNLKSVESLGCVSVICSDKTGTLTQNKMTVKKVYINNEVFNEKDLNVNGMGENLLIKEAILCNDATSEIGDPTEIALVNLSEIHYNQSGKELKNRYPCISEIPFDSDRKLMSTVHNIDGKVMMFTKGALDSILPKTKKILVNGEVRDITSEDIKNIEKVNMEFAQTGLRVLTFAYQILESEKEITREDEDNFIFIGLTAMIDPPREESKEAVAKCLTAGIKPVMITGDHKITATAIAKEIGIYKDGDNVMEGVDVEKLSDDELLEKVASTSVYARVSPEHKIRIVTAWQRLGKICAMTGDGVNDAPALKRADIGIAMGITGTEVSKDAASMILTDDNFSTIVKAVTTGRNIYANIKNSIRFLLSGNTAGILAVLYSSLVGLPVIFAPVHLLFINLLTDSLPAIAIGMEPSHGDVLTEKPRNPKEPILTKELSGKILIEGILIALFVMIGFYIGYKDNDALKASTIAFSVLCLARLFHGFNCRGGASVFGLGVFSNKFSIIAFVIGFVLLNTILLVPAFHTIFQVVPLTTNELFTIYGLAFVPTLIIQISKFIKYRR